MKKLLLALTAMALLSLPVFAGETCKKCSGEDKNAACTCKDMKAGDKDKAACTKEGKAACAKDEKATCAKDAKDKDGKGCADAEKKK